MSCPRATAGTLPRGHPSGTGWVDAMADASIRTIAISRWASASRTVPATLIEREICTSTDRASPMTLWLVAMSPAGSTRNPDACAVGVHSSTTLSSHCLSTNEVSLASGASASVVPGPIGSITTLATVRSSDKSRPATMSRVRLQR